MAKLSINKASKEWGVSRKTLQEAIKSGDLHTESGARNAKNIDTVDLLRIYGEPRTSEDTSHNIGLVMSKKQVNSSEDMIERLISTLEKDKEYLKDENERYRKESIADKEKIEALESEIRAFSSAGFFKRLSYKR